MQAQNTQVNAALVQENAEAAASQRDAAVRMTAHVDEFRLPGAVQRSTIVEGIVKHAHFHQVAGQVGELINAGQYLKAEDALAPGTAFSKATSEVVLVLSTAKRLGFH